MGHKSIAISVKEFGKKSIRTTIDAKGVNSSEDHKTLPNISFFLFGYLNFNSYLSTNFQPTFKMRSNGNGKVRNKIQ